MVDLPGSSSTFVSIEGVGPSSAKGERNAPYLALGVLSDGAQSRVSRALSKALGHLVFASKRFWCTRVGGAIGLGGTVVPSEVGAFLVAATASMRDLATTPPTDAELRDARAQLVESSEGNFESVADITGTYARLVLTGSDLGYYATMADDYAHVTPEAVRAAAARYLDPTHMRIVVVGDAAIVEPQLRALDWGPIERRDPSGVVLP
jgi:zinc protease